MTDETIRCWRLDTGQQTLVLASQNHRLPQCVYWGGPLPLAEDLPSLARAHAIDVTGGMLDANPALSLTPEADDSFPGQPGLLLADRNGAPVRSRFSFIEAEQSDGLTLHFDDEIAGLRIAFVFMADRQTNIITARTRLESDDPIDRLRLHWLAAPTLPAPQLSDGMIDISGRWIGEFQLNRTPWTPGARLRESRTGRSGHEHFPGLIVPCRGATNTVGQAYGWHYGWSGGHRMVAEELPDGRRQVQFGHAAHTETTPGAAFETAPLYLTFSNTGLNGIATAFQRHLRDRIAPPITKPRPVHYNCWEAVYFNHSLPELQDIVTRAASLGAERFVLDDGWFGKRDEDTTSLGDWTIDARKYPDGLTPLIDHVHGENMTFGLWFEPEMVNPDSDLFRAHPDWALGPHDQIPGRQQRVLDMANPAVRDHLYNAIAAILGNHAIDYVKWDHNRVLPTPDAAQTRGTYALLDRLRAAFPQVEIESCASGGGRIDFGILSRTGRVWLSDSNDALERLRIQHNAALFLPLSVTGSHVGPRHCHTSGRTHTMAFRAWVAAQRHMGFEMDPRELTEDEAQVLRDVTQWWKANRDWRTTADILRLDSADPAVIAEQQMARDATRFVVFAGKADSSAQIAPRPLRLTGLDPAAHYLIHLNNRADATHLSRGTPALKSDDITLSGRYLMDHGLTLPWSFPLTLWVIEGTRQ